MNFGRIVPGFVVETLEEEIDIVSIFPGDGILATWYSLLQRPALCRSPMPVRSKGRNV